MLGERLRQLVAVHPLGWVSPACHGTSGSPGPSRSCPWPRTHENHDCSFVWRKLHADHMPPAGRSPFHHRSTGLPGIARTCQHGLAAGECQNRNWPGDLDSSLPSGTDAVV